MPLTLPDLLCRFGGRICKEGDSNRQGEVITPLEKVRKASLLSDIGFFAKPPPVLLSDRLSPDDVFLYSRAHREPLTAEAPNLFEHRGLSVVGGAYIQTKRCSFPVTILFSEHSKTLIAHATSAPLAALEIEFFDTAFLQDAVQCCNLKTEAEACEFVEWWREASHQSRSCGIGRLSEHLLTQKPCYVSRRGVAAFLSLRVPNNAAEHKKLKARLIDDLRAFPSLKVSDLDMRKVTQMSLVFHATTAESINVPKEVMVPSQEKRELDAEVLIRVAVLSFVADAILKCANDQQSAAQDGADETHHQILSRPAHKAILAQVASEEASFCQKARLDVTTKLCEFEETSCTLPAIMSATERPYTTKCLWNAAENIEPTQEALSNSTKEALEAVVREVVHADSAQQVLDACCERISAHTSMGSALRFVGELIVDHQAIVILDRIDDGRIMRANLVTNNLYISDLGNEPLKRCVQFPFVSTVIIDRKSVSLLMIREPPHTLRDHVKTGVIREMLRMHQVGPPTGVASVASTVPGSSANPTLLLKIDELKNHIKALKNTNTTAVDSLNDFKRKLNFLVEAKVSEDSEDSQETQHGTLGVNFPVPVYYERLRETVSILTKFKNAKRPRHE